jgi:hypothetical protein
MFSTENHPCARLVQKSVVNQCNVQTCEGQTCTNRTSAKCLAGSSKKILSLDFQISPKMGGWPTLSTFSSHIFLRIGTRLTRHITAHKPLCAATKTHSHCESQQEIPHKLNGTMIQKPMESVHPFRPPKSPSSIVVHKNTHVTPKSPTRKARKDQSNKHNSNSNDVSKDALSPTSVVDPRGLFREQRRTRKQRGSSTARRSRTVGPAKQQPSANESDASLVQAGNQCIQVRS